MSIHDAAKNRGLNASMMADYYEMKQNAEKRGDRVRGFSPQ
jgi:hypothetical protein